MAQIYVPSENARKELTANAELTKSGFVLSFASPKYGQFECTNLILTNMSDGKIPDINHDKNVELRKILKRAYSVGDPHQRLVQNMFEDKLAMLPYLGTRNSKTPIDEGVLFSLYQENHDTFGHIQDSSQIPVLIGTSEKVKGYKPDFFSSDEMHVWKDAHVSVRHLDREIEAKQIQKWFENEHMLAMNLFS